MTSAPMVGALTWRAPTSRRPGARRSVQLAQDSQPGLPAHGVGAASRPSSPTRSRRSQDRFEYRYQPNIAKRGCADRDRRIFTALRKWAWPSSPAAGARCLLDLRDEEPAAEVIACPGPGRSGCRLPPASAVPTPTIAATRAIAWRPRMPWFPRKFSLAAAIHSPARASPRPPCRRHRPIVRAPEAHALEAAEAARCARLAGLGGPAWAAGRTVAAVRRVDRRTFSLYGSRAQSGRASISLYHNAPSRRRISASRRRRGGLDRVVCLRSRLPPPRWGGLGGCVRALRAHLLWRPLVLDRLRRPRSRSTMTAARK